MSLGRRGAEAERGDESAIHFRRRIDSNLGWILDRTDTPAKLLQQQSLVSVFTNVPKERIVAVGLLTQREVDVLGPTFERLWPVEDAPCFPELVKAIDEADRQLAIRNDLDSAQPR